MSETFGTRRANETAGDMMARTFKLLFSVMLYTGAAAWANTTPGQDLLTCSADLSEGSSAVMLTMGSILLLIGSFRRWSRRRLLPATAARKRVFRPGSVRISL